MHTVDTLIQEEHIIYFFKVFVRYYQKKVVILQPRKPYNIFAKIKHYDLF